MGGASRASGDYRTMMSPRVGIDHKIRWADLELVYQQWLAGMEISPTTLIPQWQHVRGLAARKKAATIMTRLWNQKRWQEGSSRSLLSETLRLHRLLGYWGLFVGTYPFYQETANTAGRLLAVQEGFTTRQLYQRMAGVYDDSERTRVGVKMILGSWVDWRLLERVKVGHYRMASRMTVDEPVEIAFLTHVALRTSHQERLIWHDIAQFPWLFPFDVVMSRRSQMKEFGLSLEQNGARELMVGER